MRVGLIIYLIIFSLHASAQNSVSFYHLGSTTYQHTNFNPSWVPEGKIFIGLPGISGIHMNANNKLSYNQLFTKESGQVILDVDKALSNLQNQNMVTTSVGVSLFHFGIRFKQGAMLSVFANDRVEVDALYSKEMVKFLWRGNQPFLGEDIKVNNVGTKDTYFREIGIGFAYSPSDYLDIGVRGKYLIGFFDASTPHNFQATLNFNPETYAIDAEWKNATLRTSGVDIFQEEEGDLASHLAMNGNAGFGIDLGATYHISPDYSIAGSITDLGFINWKEDITNYTLNDTTFFYDGVNLEDGIDDIEQVLRDSLFSIFETTENEDTYSSLLPVRATASWIYHYDKKTDIYATISSRFIQRQIKMLYGGGITRKFGKSFTLSASATKLPQQFFNVGTAFAVKGGPVQFYMAVDQMINFSVPDAKAFDFRLGINLILNEKRNKEQQLQPSVDGPKGVDTYFFQGQPIKTKKREGIYSIIPKQRPRGPVYSYPSKEATKQKNSLNGNPEKLKKSENKRRKFFKKAKKKKN